MAELKMVGQWQANRLAGQSLGHAVSGWAVTGWRAGCPTAGWVVTGWAAADKCRRKNFHHFEVGYRQIGRRAHQHRQAVQNRQAAKYSTSAFLRLAILSSTDLSMIALYWPFPISGTRK